MGTRRAVERVVTAYFGSGQVQHWYEYGGRPHFFKILTNNPQVTAEGVQILYDGSFVPPVIIAATAHDHGEKNDKFEKGIYVIDGQQRLSSILLFYLGVWSGEDLKPLPEDADDDAEEAIKAMEWKFTDLQRRFKAFAGDSLVLFVEEL